MCTATTGTGRSPTVLPGAVRWWWSTRGRVTGYATSLGLFGHAVGETDEDIQALLLSAERFDGPGVLLPTSNAELFSWCLSHGFRVVALSTLMTVGFYQPPKGASLPSVFC
jgi:hypothetical protein